MKTIPLRSAPIKVRLTAWYFVVMAVAMSALGALALEGMKHSIRTTVDEQLADRIKVVEKLIAGFSAHRIARQTYRRPPRKPQAGQPRATRPNLRRAMATASSTPPGSRAALCSRPPGPCKCKKSAILSLTPRSPVSRFVA